MLLAMFLCFTLYPLGILYGIVRHLFYADKKALDVALLLDLGGNVFCRELMNDIFIKDDTKGFGSPFQTIREVLGINNELDNLTKLGKYLVRLLDYLDPYHVEKSIGKTVPIVKLSLLEQIKRFTIVLSPLILILILCISLVII